MNTFNDTPKFKGAMVDTATTTEDQLRRIAFLNEKGASALMDGDAREAHHTLRAVIGGLGSLAASAPLRQDESALQVKVLISLTVPQFEDDRFFVCSDALIFGWINQNSSSEGFMPFSVADVSFCSSVALYNMALTYHKRAMNTGSRQSFLMAARIYERAFEVLSQITVFSRDLNKMKILLFNNLAHIYYFELGEHEKAIAFLEQIRFPLYMYLEGPRAQMDGFHTIPYERIVLNLMMTGPPFAASCA